MLACFSLAARHYSIKLERAGGFPATEEFCGILGVENKWRNYGKRVFRDG